MQHEVPARADGRHCRSAWRCLLGRTLVAALVNKYGIEVFHLAVQSISDQSEAAVRAKIRAVPDGIYEAEAFLDNDGVTEKPIPIKVKVIIAGDEMTIDYSEMAKQVPSCINSGFAGGGGRQRGWL